MSDKILSDYIQYYIGCKINKDQDALDYPIIEGIDRSNVIISGYRYKTPNCESIFHRPRIWRSIDSIKPILRKLEDWTTEELIKYNSIVGKKTDGVHSVLIHYDTPETFHWLLKQGFDLFGLIDEQLAIDAKTLK